MHFRTQDFIVAPCQRCGSKINPSSTIGVWQIWFQHWTFTRCWAPFSIWHHWFPEDVSGSDSYDGGWYSLHDKLTQNFFNDSSPRSIRKNCQALLWTGHETHCTHVTHPIQTLPPQTHCCWNQLSYWRATLWYQAFVWPTTRKSRGARPLDPLSLNVIDPLERSFVVAGICASHRTHVTRCTQVTHCTHCTQCTQLTHCTRCTPPATHCHLMSLTRWREALW